MLKYLVMIPLFLVGALGCAVQEVYGDDMVSTINLTFTGRTISELYTREAAADAEVSALAFAERVNTLKHLSNSGFLNRTDALVLRSTITDRFHDAFTAITRLEDEGRFDEAAPARDIMQIAIEDHMEHASMVTPEITRDLDVFSKFMTETLIERLNRAAS